MAATFLLMNSWNSHVYRNSYKQRKDKPPNKLGCLFIVLLFLILSLVAMVLVIGVIHD